MSHKRIKSNFAFTFFEDALSPFNVAVKIRFDIRHFRTLTRGVDREFFRKRTRKGHRQSDEHWNRFKGDVGETSERRGWSAKGFFERIDIILN